jgi:predicted HTH domain antitoxin
MSSINITISVPEASLSILRATPQVFAQEVCLAAAVKWYELGKISQAKAAELAGVSRAEFLQALGEYHVSPYQITEEELTAEIAGNA